jgi:hypothetical protein
MNMRFSNTAIGFVLLAMGFFYLQSCAKNEVEDHHLSSDEYYPYKAGNIREYNMDSTYYNQVTGKVTRYHFLLREIVTDSLTDLSGDPVWRIEQYVSRDSGKNYEFYALHSVKKDATGFQRVMENQRYLKLSIPISEKKKWNGNIYNILGEEEYQYTAVGKAYSNDYLSFNNCVFVTELSDSSIISADQRSAIYAADYGLVHKYDKSLRYTFKDTQEMVGGTIVELKLRKFWVK